jgi:hypothetical protein
MNRRQAIKTGAIGLTGLSIVGRQALNGDVLAQQEEVQFGSKPADVLTPYNIQGKVKPLMPSASMMVDSSENRSLLLASDNSPRSISNIDLSTQFLAFQTEMVNGAPTVLESSMIEPKLETPEATPDVVMDISMQAFHIGDNEPIDKDTRATLRLTVNKDADSLGGRGLDTLFWTITSGLKLYDEIKNRKADSKDLQADYKKAFGNRFIEIPGGLGDIRFEVIKHQEPSWWQQIFKFLEGDTGKALAAALGFPAVTQQVVNFVDQAVSHFEGKNPKALFASQPLKFAFSKQSRDAYINSAPVKIGSLNQGIWIFARGRDLKLLSNTKAYFYATYGRLIPADKTPADFLAPGFVDPFKDVTYGVFRVQMQKAKLGYSFNA